MRNLKLLFLPIFFGLFTVAAVGQERQQEQQQEGQQERQIQERSIEVNDLPQSVKETLQEDYEDWRATEASLSSDPEEGTFYKVKVQNNEDAQETKTLKIATDGEVIDEEGKSKDKDKDMDRSQQRDGDSQYAPATQDRGQQDREQQGQEQYGQHERGQQGQGQQDRAQQGQEQRGQQGQQGQQHMQHMQQERDVQVTDLPQEVQETLREDFEDWSATSVQMTSDAEQHEEGPFYKVTMNKMDNGERETKIVSISMDGEVIDEEEGKDKDKERTQQRDGQQRDGAAVQQDRGQQQQGQQHQEGRQQQQQQLKVTDLPKDVQETLSEDYEDWQPVDVQVTTDREVYEEGSFYKVRMNKTDNGERETKIVKIARDGEVIDEEDVDEKEMEKREGERRQDGRQR